MTDERKNYILRLIDLNTKLDTLRINIALITYNLTQHDEIKLKDLDFTKLTGLVDTIFALVNYTDNEKDVKENESKKDIK